MREDIYERVWISLIELKDMVGLCQKGIEMEKSRDNSAFVSILSIVERRLCDVLGEMDVTM